MDCDQADWPNMEAIWNEVNTQHLHLADLARNPRLLHIQHHMLALFEGHHATKVSIISTSKRVNLERVMGSESDEERFSIAFYLSIVTCWALKVQFLLQIIVNRCAILLPDR